MKTKNVIGYVLACEESAVGPINPVWFPVQYPVTNKNRSQFEKDVRKKYIKINKETIAEDIQKEYKYKVKIFYKEDFAVYQEVRNDKEMENIYSDCPQSTWGFKIEKTQIPIIK